MASITDDNILVMNQGKNPLVNFNFMLRVEMIYDLPCKSVRAFSRELEYDFIQEGGLNDYVHMRRKPISKPFTLEIERYVGVDYIDPLPLGADLVLPVMLFVSRAHSQFIPGVVARTYTFTGCTVMKKTYGDLVADQSGLLVETTTIGYREMVCTDIPWSEVGDNIFASTTSAPTNASSLDKSAQDFKILGQNLYEQALEAKTRSETEYVSTDLDGILQELETAASQLSSATAPGGTLPAAVQQAEAVLAGTDGKTLRETADESQMVAREKEAAAKAAEQDWREKDTAYQNAQREADLLQEQVSELTARSADLDAQLERDKAEEAAIKERLAEQGISSSTEAQKALVAAQSAFDSAQDAVDAAQQALQNSLDNPEEGDKLDALQAEIDAAAEARNAAQAALSAAELGVQDHERLAALADSMKETESQAKEVAANLATANSQKAAADQAVSAAKTPADSARAAYDKALQEWNTAAEKAEQDLAAVETAVRNLSEANTQLSSATRSVRALQNHLTNLRSRKETVNQSQTDCTEQYNLCQTANDTLQGLPDEPLTDINNQYETVKKHSKQTVYHSRQVLETVQHMASARESLAEAEALLSPEAEAVNG